MADKWGEGGGHFEKKILFGFDADLTRVRAEFDGDLLTITIPRRATSDLLH
jgi:HSP20 family molecular chaperone IbpA